MRRGWGVRAGCAVVLLGVSGGNLAVWWDTSPLFAWVLSSAIACQGLAVVVTGEVMVRRARLRAARRRHHRRQLDALCPPTDGPWDAPDVRPPGVHPSRWTPGRPDIRDF